MPDGPDVDDQVILNGAPAVIVGKLLIVNSILAETRDAMAATRTVEYCILMAVYMAPGYSKEETC